LPIKAGVILTLEVTLQPVGSPLSEQDFTGDTQRKAPSRLIIPENAHLDDHLLAHELGHVLRLCHPNKYNCNELGTYHSIMDPQHVPLRPYNSTSNCQQVRKPGLELMKSS